MKKAYTRGDKVWWWSKQGGKGNKSKAIFVEDDPSFPAEDVILAIKIGKTYVQTFRWPRRLTEPVKG